MFNFDIFKSGKLKSDEKLFTHMMMSDNDLDTQPFDLTGDFYEVEDADWELCFENASLHGVKQDKGQDGKAAKYRVRIYDIGKASSRK